MTPRSPTLLLGCAALLLGAACGSNALPAPTLMQIAPAAMSESEALTAGVTVQAVLPFDVSFGQSSATADPAVTIQIGPITPVASRLDANGKAALFIPSVLEAGSYDVTVSLADGRSATLDGGFTVTPGTWPTSYELDPIGDQRASTPFVVTVRARGPAASTFHGTVALSAPGRGRVSPAESGPFVDGVRVETISIDPTSAGPDTAVLVRDLRNHVGLSNVFKLNP